VSVRDSRSSRTGILAALLLGGCVVAACGDAKRPSSAPAESTGGAGAGTKASSAGSTDQTPGGDAAGGEAAVAGQGGAGNAGDNGVGEGGVGNGVAGSDALGGAGPDPIPPVGDPPICVHGRVFAAGTRLPQSGAGDDILQAITPDDLTIAWKNGQHFFVADWDGENGGFLAPHEVAASAQYSAVTLSPDGLTLIGIEQDLSIVEQTRSALAAFDDAAPTAGDFAQFNAARASIPLANQVLADILVAAADNSIFFSHFTTGYAGSRATVFEGGRSGTAWSFTNPDLGKLLYAADDKRRIPTGISSDSLTLFYLDELSGDFRAAWRINKQVPFNYSEVLTLADGVQAAAPTASCQRIYYSAPGSDGLDLFFSDAAP
jgi:hypothetical protein